MQLTVEGSGGRPVRARVHGPPDAMAVLVLHGFKGFADWGPLPWLAQRIASAGFRAIRPDFSHNGVEERDFDRLDLFLLDTWTRHQEDLGALARALPGPLALVGHSRGGADALLFAAREPRVCCVATLAGVASTTDLEPADADAVLRERGYYPVPNARTGQTMPLARSAFDDARRHDVEGAARSLSIPLLFVHGTADESVPLAHLGRLAAANRAAGTLAIEGAGHTFGARHPFAGPTPALEQATDAVVAFLRRHVAQAAGLHHA